ncbi:hypothetical protein D3C86_2013190 [compost metagenome]
MCSRRVTERNRHSAKHASGTTMNTLRLPLRSERLENSSMPNMAPRYGRMANMPTMPMPVWVNSLRMVGNHKVYP